MGEDRWSECTFALVDVAVGEEITKNYGTYETLDWYEKLCIKHGVESTTVCAGKYIILSESSMCVPFEVRASPLGGVGIFATEPISACTCVWNFDQAKVETYTESEARRHFEQPGMLGAFKVSGEYAYWVAEKDGQLLIELKLDV